MDWTSMVIWAAAGVAAAVLAVRAPGRLGEALRLTWSHSILVLPTLFMAVVASGFLARLLPQEVIAGWIGPRSGFTGIIVASAVGGLIPGGPMISFPLAVTLARAGAGMPQMVALVTAWSLIAFHRVVAWELPLMGTHFVLKRILASMLLPPLSGASAALLLALTG